MLPMKYLLCAIFSVAAIKGLFAVENVDPCSTYSGSDNDDYW
jgi:hypothetical protein